MSNDLWDAAFDAVVDYIDKKADDTNLRKSYYKMMSDRRWKNSAMSDLIDGIVAAERKIEDEYMRNNVSERRALNDAVRDIVDGHFASVILADRDLADELPQRQYDQMREAADRFDSLLTPSRRRGSRDRDDDRDDRREYGGSSRRDVRDDRDDRDDRRSFGEGGRSRSTTSRSREVNDNDPWSMLSQIDDAYNQPETHVNEDGSREEPARPAPAREREIIEYEAPRRETRRSNVEGPDFTKADPYGEYWLKGEHWVVAHRSVWELDDPIYEGAELIPRWHDLNLFVKYYVKNSEGQVREELIEVSNDNRYLNQDLRVQRGEQPTERRSAAVNLRALRKPQSEEDILNTSEVVEQQRTVDLVAQLVDVAEMVPQLTESNPVDSLVAATFSGRSKMLAADRSVDLLLGYMRTPLAASNWDQLELLDRIADAPSLVAAAELMNELKPMFDLSVWNKLNERYTTLALRSWNFQFHFNAVKQMNFARDCSKVMNHMAKVRGEEFASMVGARTRKINALACSYVSRDQLSSTIADLGADAEKFPAVVFIDFLEIVSLDATLDELGLSSILAEGNVEKGLSITDAGNRKLAGALRRIFEAVSASLVDINARVLLSTADNFLIEVTPYAARTEAFVFSLAQ